MTTLEGTAAIATIKQLIEIFFDPIFEQSHGKKLLLNTYYYDDIAMCLYYLSCYPGIVWHLCV